MSPRRVPTPTWPDWHAFSHNMARTEWSNVNMCLRHEGVWGSGCIDPHFLNLGTSWRWVVSFMLRPLYPRGRSPSTHWIGGWVGPRADLYDLAKIKFLTLSALELRHLGRPARSQSLYRQSDTWKYIGNEPIGGRGKRDEKESRRIGFESRGEWEEDKALTEGSTEAFNSHGHFWKCNFMCS
jgi:hypothetical protein